MLSEGTLKACAQHIGDSALVQALFPFAAYLAAVALPMLVFRHRRAFR